MKLKFLDPLLLKISPSIIASYFHIMGSSTYLKVVGPENLNSRNKIFGFKNGVIYCTWHSRFFFFGYFGRGKRVVTMISASKDGEHITRGISKMRLDAVRGSSSRQGKQALWEMVDLARQNRRLFMILDGPRGPKYEAKAGIIRIAQESGRPIVPVSYSSTKGIFLPSWDRFFLPFPCGKGVVTAGEPIYVPQNISEQDFEQKRLEVQKAVTHVMELGDSLCGRNPEKEVVMKHKLNKKKRNFLILQSQKKLVQSHLLHNREPL